MNRIAQDRITDNGIDEVNNLRDNFARSVSYLRLSLTDKCNLRCLYCTPKTSSAGQFHVELLNYEELLRITSLAVDLGIQKVRLTGGEPLVRPDVGFFVKKLTLLPDLRDVRLTTNGVYLAQYASDLYEAGISKINISLDTLCRKRYLEITGRDCFNQVWQGLMGILSTGFFKVKINVVALRGVNDDEFLDFARLALSHDIQVRFIEYMPLGTTYSENHDRYISSSEIKDMIRKGVGALIRRTGNELEGPATVYQLLEDGGSGPAREGKVGFISPISHKFCASCNRLRLTAHGKLRSCLLSDKEIDLRFAVRRGADDRTIKDILLQAIMDKPRGHDLLPGQPRNCHGEMSHIGG